MLTTMHSRLHFPCSDHVDQLVLAIDIDVDTFTLMLHCRVRNQYQCAATTPS
jgi:hypothetical protein